MKENTPTIKQLEDQISDLQRRLSDEQHKNSFTNAILEGGALIIWAINSEKDLTSFNQNYFNFFLQKDAGEKVGYEKGGVVTYVNLEKFWNTKYEQSLKGSSSNFEICIDVDNTHGWKEVFLTPIYDSRGDITGVSGLAYDITEKMESKLALIKSEEKFRNIFESFQDLYFRCDFRGILSMLSPSVEDITGYSEQELLGKNVTNYYLYNIKTKHLLQTLRRDRSVRNFEASLVHKSGKIIYCICNMRIIYDDAGEPQCIEGVARDISELKKTTEELQRSKELAEKSLKIKEKFLANMSHEIRTPLNGIIGMLHLLDETSLDEKQTRHVKALKSSSDILLNILNDLLDISKIEAGKMELKQTPVNTNELLSKLILLYQQQAKDKGIALKQKLDNSIPSHIVTDETKLLQVYSNLVSNAIKFTPAGGSVTASLKLKKNKKNGHLILKGKVKDTGIGIKKEDQERLFSIFTQLDSSRSKIYKGTGLGLHISKKIIKLLNGKIGIKSEQGKGSAFWFTFETEPVEIKEELNIPEEELVNLNHNPKILVVDDNKVNLELASEMLKNAGGDVTTADGGIKAIDLCLNNVYDIVLMDIQMPDMDGIETTKRIRETCEHIPPVIAMTAYSLHGDKEKFLGAGFDDFVPKPIQPRVLFKQVKKWTSSEMDNSDEKEVKDDERILLDINVKTLETLRKYAGDEVLRETLIEFDNECQSQISACSTLHKQEKFKEMSDVLHTLKGNASTLGVEKLAGQAEIMEDKAKNKKYPNFETDLIQLKTHYESFVIELQSLIN